MEEHDLTSPLLSPRSSSQPQTVLTIRDDEDSESSDQSPSNRKSSLPPYTHHRNHNHSRVNYEKLTVSSTNPYDFLGSGEYSVPAPTTVDPFRNGTPFISGLYEVIKIILCLPIALARLVLFGACLAVGYVATRIALEGWKDKQNPMPKWRSRIMWITRFCARFILFSFGYQWIRRKGKPAPRDIAPIVVSNHVSYIEPIFYFYELFPTIVASESHDSMPFVGTIIRAMQVIYVNRFSPASRKNAVNEIKRRAACDKFPRVLLFPEGTTTNGKVLMSFQLGAFIPGHPVQPIIVRYPHVHFDQSWGLISLAKLMFRMFTQFHNFMEVEYLPAVMPPDHKIQSPVHFADRTGQAMASALNVVQTSHSYGDLMLLMKAAELQQERPWSFMVEMARIESLFQISSLEAVDFLDKFLSMNPDTSGCVKLHDFLRVLRLKSCKLSEEIFGFLDVAKNGSITFKQFLFGVAHVMKQPLFKQACELAFAECDVRRDNYCMKEELADILRQAIPDLNEDEVHGLFELFDTDNDGRISRDDFLSCLRKNPLLIALFSPRLLQKDFPIAGDRMLEEIV
ncbi:LYSOPHOSPHATIDYLETHANOLAMINE ACYLTRANSFERASE2 [Hibiscus trionum]|uniref:LYSOPHOSPHATIDYLETHANOLAMINE ACYLTRANSFERASE2 n=1 Tax=Hibiscus trionum TaxID=183268 RepID=A0A9W7IQ56_HIBTR|nr:LYSOPHOSPHATIDYLETHANOLAMINE ACYLTRANSFERASE2 [Hibiscus trionum]